MKLHPGPAISSILALGLTWQAATCRADVLDWNNITYAPSAAAAQSQSAAFASANGSNSVRIQFTLTNSTFAAAGNVNNQAYQFPISASYSQSAAYTSGGGANTQKSLQIGANFSSNSPTVTSSMLVTLFFAQPVVSTTFNFFDVDTNASGNAGYIDKVSGIQGSVNGGTAVIPTVTTTGSTNDTASGNTITGTGNSAQNVSTSNATVTFDSSTPINQLSFVYGDNFTGTNHAAIQIVALSNINFTNSVPEPGTLAMLGLGVFGAAVVTLRRRQS